MALADGPAPAYDTTFPATKFHEIVWVTTYTLQTNTMSSRIEIDVHCAWHGRQPGVVKNFIVGRQPDIARGIKYYLLSRGFGSNHVCPAKAALRDRPHLFRLCIDA
jgi:hypothetical protein